MRHYKIVIFLVFSSFYSHAQEYILDSIKTVHSFVNYDSNRIKYAEESPNFKRLYHTFDMIRKGYKRDLHIFHIGGSHIQADMYSNKLRSYFQNMSSTAKGQRGFIYPFKVAETNNPSNYYVKASGEWEGFRCSKRDSVAWGMSGISATFNDSTSNIYVKANYRNFTEEPHEFNRIRVFYDEWTSDYEVELEDYSLVCNTSINAQGHFIEFQLNQSVKEIGIKIRRLIEDESSEFVLMGLELMNDNQGIEYTSIGVNGASFESYEKCYFFYQQMELYNPDMYIISIGTNDTYTTDFDADMYKERYRRMIESVLKINPDCAILLTVPNDSYYKRKYANPFTKDAERVIHELAVEYKMAVWDFYEIMGGFKSSQAWYEQKLMPSDRIHFSRTGYSIKADLLLEALSHSMEQVLGLPENTVLNHLIHE